MPFYTFRNKDGFVLSIRVDYTHENKMMWESVVFGEIPNVAIDRLETGLFSEARKLGSTEEEIKNVKREVELILDRQMLKWMDKC